MKTSGDRARPGDGRSRCPSQGPRREVQRLTVRDRGPRSRWRDGVPRLVRLAVYVIRGQVPSVPLVVSLALYPKKSPHAVYHVGTGPTLQV